MLWDIFCLGKIHRLNRIFLRQSICPHVYTVLRSELQCKKCIINFSQNQFSARMLPCSRRC